MPVGVYTDTVPSLYVHYTVYVHSMSRSRIHERTISLRFLLGIILRLLRLELSILQYKPVATLICSRGKSFVPITSKNSASGAKIWDIYTTNGAPFRVSLSPADKWPFLQRSVGPSSGGLGL
jgi:hypothetical protein